MAHKVILFIHPIVGFFIFLTGLLQIFLKKGGSFHKIVGKIYVSAWLLLLSTGAYLGGPIMTVIGLFGYYYALTGSIVVRSKHRPLNKYEKAVFIGGGLVAAVMFLSSFVLLWLKDYSFAAVFFGFGILFVRSAIQDISKYILQKPTKQQIYGTWDWYFEHFIRMFISLIPALTAFSSIRGLFKEMALNFLIPTGLGIILILIAEKMYRVKLHIVKPSKTAKPMPNIIERPLETLEREAIAQNSQLAKTSQAKVK